MKRISIVASLLVTTLVLIAAPCIAGGGAAPVADNVGSPASMPGSSMDITLNVPIMSSLFSDFPIAVVNDDPITVQDLTKVLASEHEKAAGAEDGRKIKMSFSAPLNRLINTKLIVQEARNMGLDELPEIKTALDSFAKKTLIRLLVGNATKDITVDEKEVESVYRERVKEWKIKSILFHRKKDAVKTRTAIAAGTDYDTVAGKALKDGTARGSEDAHYVNADTLNSDILKRISKMHVGTVSPVITVGQGKGASFTLVKLEDVRFPENAQERERAKSEALSAKKRRAVLEYRDKLYRKYVVFDKRLFKNLNYEAKKPGIKKLLTDRRVLAKIAGEKPVLVKDLSEAIKGIFFHGVEEAIKENKVNKIKQGVLDNIISKRVFQKEALLQGIDKTARYKELTRNEEEAVLFGTFVKKVIVPNAKVGDEDIKAYYDDHLGDYTYPAMMKIDGLAFDKPGDAESALNKLNKGADYTWIRSNAEGRTKPDAEHLLTFGDTLLVVTTMPEGIQKALTGARQGDYRLAAGSDGRYYVLSVLQVVPERRQPVEDAASTIVQKAFDIKVRKSIEEWGEKLRNEADVKVYLVNK